MNILFLDNDKDLTHLFQHLDTTDEIDIFFCKDEIDTLNAYYNNPIDIVIIDFTIDYGKSVLEQILKHNQHQKVITISDILACSEHRGCDYCQEKYNKIRLLKPINTSQLVQCIKYFDSNQCRYFENFSSNDGLVNIMDDIIRRFNGATYDSKTKTIQMNYSSKIMDIIQFLDNKDIQFDILHNNSIQIKEAL